jgi:hypothetical protein
VVDERSRTTEGEAAPLDERAGCLRRIATFGVLDVDVDIRPQRAVGGLRAGIDAEVGPVPSRIAVDRTVLRARGGRHVRVAAVPVVVGPDVSAEPDTGVLTWDVIEPVSIERADLHVLDRCGLDGKIGSLRPGNHGHTRRGSEEKTFHHLHVDPSKLRYWRVMISAGASHR